MYWADEVNSDYTARSIISTKDERNRLSGLGAMAKKLNME